MKTLLVLRHAKASQDSPSNLDFDRPLNGRGRRQALALGCMLRDRRPAIELIVASPATRVAGTIAGVSGGAGLGIEPVYDRRLYNASPESLIEVICEADDRSQCLLIVGHNPGLHQLLLYLADTDSGGLRGQLASGYPTATLVEMQFVVERWRDVGRQTGRLISLVRPEE